MRTISSGESAGSDGHGRRIIGPGAAVIAAMLLLPACAAHEAPGSRLAQQRVPVGAPVPPASMLRAQGEPDCARREAAAGLITANAGEGRLQARIRQLEFERSCYRQYEIQARHRLLELQAATRRTIRALRRQEVAIR